MELNNFKIEESTELTVLQEINIDENIFYNIVEIINKNMTKLGIQLDDKIIYYQRYANKTSILAIKLCKGEDTDTNNFMFNGCDATYFNGHNTCDVYLHANKKVGQTAMQMANMMSKDITEFFDCIEGELAIKGLSETELFIRIPLVADNKKQKDNKENRILKLIRNIFPK